MGEISAFLAMDRTTLTAALKPLSRRKLVQVTTDPRDTRARRLRLSNDGRALLAEALPVWRAEHNAVDSLLLALEGGLDLETLRAGIGLLGQVDRLAPPAPIDGDSA